MSRGLLWAGPSLEFDQSLVELEEKSIPVRRTSSRRVCDREIHL
jgi:hypothetical protein